MNAFRHTDRHTDIEFDVLGLMGGRMRIRARGRVEISRRAAPREAVRPARPAFVPTVGEFIAPLPWRVAQAVASAAIVRDAAAFGALILFATMLAVLCNADPMV